MTRQGGGPILACAGAYEVLADEAGNRSQTGELALAVLNVADEVRSPRGLRALHALRELVQWTETLHGRIRLCPRRCGACHDAREHYARIGVYLDEEV